MSPATIPSNSFYGQLNRRFDKRLKQLVQLGFTYVRLPEFETAIVTRKRYGKPQTIAASTLAQACPRVWRDTLSRLLTRGY